MKLEFENGMFHVKEGGAFIASGTTPEIAKLNAIQAIISLIPTEADQPVPVAPTLVKVLIKDEAQASTTPWLLLTVLEGGSFTPETQPAEVTVSWVADQEQATDVSNIGIALFVQHLSAAGNYKKVHFYSDGTSQSFPFPV